MKRNKQTTKSLFEDFETQKISGEDNYRAFMTEEDPEQIGFSKKLFEILQKEVFEQHNIEFTVNCQQLTNTIAQYLQFTRVLINTNRQQLDEILNI
jgi:hypothetical protein